MTEEIERTEQVKTLHSHIVKLVNNKADNANDRAMLTVLIYAGMLSETLFEYDEPDVVMEQTFYRISDLLEKEPDEINPEVLDKIMPVMDKIDLFTEKGRSLSIKVAEQLDNDMDDVHEIIIGLIISDFPEFALDNDVDMDVAKCLRVLMEAVIVCTILEMAAQEFCDILIEDFIAEGWTVDLALASLAGLVMVYGLESLPAKATSNDIGVLQNDLMTVISEEVKRHADNDTGIWSSLNPVNDEQDNSHYKEMAEELKEPIEEFFGNVGFETKMGQAVAVAKSVGRMVAVSSSEDAGYIPGPIGQMVVMRGMQSVISEIGKNKNNSNG